MGGLLGALAAVLPLLAVLAAPAAAGLAARPAAPAVPAGAALPTTAGLATGPSRSPSARTARAEAAQREGAAAETAEVFRAGVEAYRRGDHATALELWRSLTGEPLTRAQRGVLYYDLGNAAYRAGAPLEAVAWYTSAVRTTPRDADAWRNLEFVRREAGLDPADRGDLSSTLARLLSSLDRDEAGWLALSALALLALVLAGEALVGGLLLRRLAVVAALLAFLAAVPLAWRTLSRPDAPLLMAIERPAVGLRSEPREDSPPVAQAPAGSEVELVDRMPGWVRVRTADGRRGWVRGESLQELFVPR